MPDRPLHNDTGRVRTASIVMVQRSKYQRDNMLISKISNDGVHRFIVRFMHLGCFPISNLFYIINYRSGHYEK